MEVSGMKAKSKLDDLINYKTILENDEVYILSLIYNIG